MSSTAPNLPDYLSFLSRVVGIPPADTPQVMPTLAGTASNGSVNTLVDVSQTWTLNQWAGGYSVVDVTQNQTAEIASNDPVTLTFATPLTNAVAPADQYLIVPDVVLTSLAIAQEIVNDTLNCVSSRIYTLAVYNLAADRLINYAPDVPGQTWFADKRADLRIMDVSVGVPSSANDAGTGVGILNPEQMKTFTLGDLQTLKTYPGRRYMSIASAYGANIWGLS